MLGSLGTYILLLLAVAIGWLLGRLTLVRKNSSQHRPQELFADYFVGLNYLLNDEPDEAIDTFIKALEINSETIETHLALGALLRRRGKVDKAIKVHQALLARPGLDSEFADATRLQLSVDYVSAGLLDRAERLLNELLIADSPAKAEALKQLITIYQTEKEWERAIQCCGQLVAIPGHKKDVEIRAAAAHYCCELAEEFLAQNQSNKARNEVKRAFEFNRKSVRACLLLAKVEHRLGNIRAAIKELIGVLSSNPEFVSQILPPLADYYRHTGKLDEYEKLLRNTLREHSDVSLVLALTELIASRSGAAAAYNFLNTHVQQEPALVTLLELMRLQVPAADEKITHNLRLLQEMITGLLQKKPAYQCHHCGYESRTLYWLCPSCQKWDEIKPIAEVILFKADALQGVG